MRESDCHYQDLSFRQFHLWLNETSHAQCLTTQEEYDADSNLRGGSECRKRTKEQTRVDATGCNGEKHRRLHAAGAEGGEGHCLSGTSVLAGRSPDEWWGYADYKRFHELFASESASVCLVCVPMATA